MHSCENMSLNLQILYTRQEDFQGDASSCLISKAKALKIAAAFLLPLVDLPLHP